jgi:putative transposase
MQRPRIQISRIQVRPGARSPKRSPRSSVRCRARQLKLPLPATWGGARVGAGRKPAPGRRSVPHRTRDEHSHREPVHVTLRSRFRPLRSLFVFPTLRRAISQATQQEPSLFRVVQFSVQSDHVHFIVEAHDKRALSRGMQGLAIRIARAVNTLVRRRGKVWADRWHGRALGSPRAVRNALAYVLRNFRKHGVARTDIDPYSSAPYFNGFRELRGDSASSLARRGKLSRARLAALPLAPRGLAPADEPSAQNLARPRRLAAWWLAVVSVAAPREHALMAAWWLAVVSVAAPREHALRLATVYTRPTT